MTQDIREGFLNDSEQRGTELTIDLLIRRADRRPGTDAGALGEILCQPLERGGKTQLIENWRAQVGGGAAHALYQGIDHARGFMQLAAEPPFRPGFGILRGRRVELQRRPWLPQTAWKLPRES